MAESTVDTAIIWQDPWHFLAFGFGLGDMPFMPGTFGTLAAVPFCFLLTKLSLPLYLGFVVLTFVLGCWLCGRCSLALGVHDHGGIVFDEMVGFWITLCAVKVTWLNLLLGFVLFRFFDILKPWPIKWCDKQLTGGFGIMFDDVLAGVMAWLCLFGLSWLAS